MHDKSNFSWFFQVHVSFRHYTTPHVLSIKFEKLTQPILELTKKLLLVASWTRMKDLSKWFDFFIPKIIDSDPILSQNWNPNSLKWNLMHFYVKEKKNSFSTNLRKFVTTAFDTWPLFFSIEFILFHYVIRYYQNLSHFQWSIGFSFQVDWNFPFPYTKPSVSDKTLWWKQNFELWRKKTWLFLKWFS